MIGSTLGSVIYLLVSLVTSMIVYLAVIALLIIASSWLLGSAARSVFPRRTDSPILIDPCGSTIHNFMSGAWRYAMCIAAVGYVSGVSRAIARLGAADTLMLNVLLSIGMLLACIALLILWEGMRRTLTFRATYTAIFFLMALGLILLPFLGTGYYTLFAGLANLAFTIASMFMMITCLRLSHLRSLDPIGVFGPFATIVYAGVSAGRLVGSSMFGSALGFSQILLAVLLCVYVLSFTGVIMSMARKAPHGSQTSAADFDPLDELSYSARSVSEEGDGTPGCAEAAGGRIDVPTFSGTREAASQIKAGRRPFKCEPAYSKVPPPHQMLRSVVVVHDAIPACCQAMKQTYQLSNREADVLELIARGRDTAHVAEALFVSENTVKSHCKNLYRKLGIHSRQELFDLIDEFKGSDEHH